MTNILSSAQAAAVYAAMVALNDVGARVHVRRPGRDYSMWHVTEYEDGTVVVFMGDAVGNPVAGLPVEWHSSQAHFAAHYGLAGSL